MLPREHYLKQTFQDGVNFPDGFEKGGLSDIQSRLLRKHGVLISALSQDEVSDPSADDLHILKVISNQSAPKSPIEQAWLKYLTLVKSKQVDAPSKPTRCKAKAKTAAVAESAPVATAAEPSKAAAPKSKATSTKKVVTKAAPAAPSKTAATKTRASDTPINNTKAAPKAVESTPAKTAVKAAAKEVVTAKASKPAASKKAAPASKTTAKKAVKS